MVVRRLGRGKYAATRRGAARIGAHTTIASVAHRGGYRETRRQICGKLSERGDIGTRSLSRRWENEWDARTRNVHTHVQYIYLFIKFYFYVRYINSLRYTCLVCIVTKVIIYLQHIPININHRAGKTLFSTHDVIISLQMYTPSTRNQE